jgi:hypothetical protein
VSSRELLLRLFPVQSLLIIAEAVRESGVARVTFRRSLFGVPGMYDAEANEITIDPDVDREVLAKKISRDAGMPVEAGEVHLWILLHELGHARRRRFLPRCSGFFSRLWADKAEAWEEDRLADEYARERFRKFLWSTGRGRN